MRFNGTLMSSIMISALALSAAPALAQERPDGSADVAKAMERDLGLTAGQIKELGPQQERAVKLDEELKRSLGDAYAGSEFDLESGKLIVMVSDKGLLEKAQASGADARFAAHSLKELDGIKADLDRLAGGGVPGKERAIDKGAEPAADQLVGRCLRQRRAGHDDQAPGRGRQGARGQVRRRGLDRDLRRGA